MPIENYEEAELLAWVEQDLEPAAAAALDQRLQRDPQLRAALVDMRADRQLLRSMPQPEPPIDLFAALESRLARPMLLEQRAGAYRRTQRRRRREAPWRRLAIAAVLLIALGGGLWAASLFLGRSTLPGDERVAAEGVGTSVPLADPAGGLDGSLAAGDRVDSWPPPGTVVHHRHPLPAREVVASRGGEGAGGAVAEGTHTASFLLVMESRDVSAAEDALIRILRDLASQSPDASSRTPAATALVRNFTYDEALAMLKRPHRSIADTRELSPEHADVSGRDAPASGDGEEVRRRIEQMIRRFDIGGRAGDEPGTTGRQLFGERESAPSYADQLELSKRGATHTVAVPVSLVGELLQRLEFHAAARTMLEPLPPPPVGHPPDGGVLPPRPEDDARRLERWISQRDVIRDQLLDLRRQAPAGVVLLPIAIVAE